MDSPTPNNPYLDVQRAVRRSLDGHRRSLAAFAHSRALRETVWEGRRRRELDADGAQRTAQVAARRLEKLRPRELEILLLYAVGLSTDEIAQALYVSEHTVRTHVKNALAHLEVHARNEALGVVRHGSGSAQVSLAAMRILPELERWAKGSRAVVAQLEALATGAG